jgi:hypothetical protein
MLSYIDAKKCRDQHKNSFLCVLKWNVFEICHHRVGNNPKTENKLRVLILFY